MALSVGMNFDGPDCFVSTCVCVCVLVTKQGKVTRNNPPLINSCSIGQKGVTRGEVIGFVGRRRHW